VFAAGVLLFLERFELEFPVIDESADRRAGLRRDLDQVDLPLRGDRFGPVDRDYPKLVVLVVDQSNFGRTDLVVDAQFLKRDLRLLLPVTKKG
jgi:hypothetical protein